jgi:TetR/AcrR family transcriptional regulator, copper-responsive repressor
MVQKDAKPPPKTRGRPKAYDRDKALNAMREVFWKQGYAGTSVDDLSESSGMNRPSLYNAFGDKAEVFTAVLDDYIDELRQVYNQAFRADLPLKDSLRRIYETILEVYSDRDGIGRGCFLIGAALTESLRDTGVAERLRQGLSEIDAAFVWRLERAKRQGELKPDADVDLLAVVASATHNALSVRMRAGASKDSLRHMINCAIRVICGAS